MGIQIYYLKLNLIDKKDKKKYDYPQDDIFQPTKHPKNEEIKYRSLLATNQ